MKHLISVDLEVSARLLRAQGKVGIWDLIYLLVTTLHTNIYKSCQSRREGRMRSGNNPASLDPVVEYLRLI